MINAPSLANCNFVKMEYQIQELVKGGVTLFHIDIMDGHYVPNLCFPVNFVRDIKREYPQVAVDVHLMVTNPMDYIVRLKECGAEYVSFHIDSTNFVRRTLTCIWDAGMKAGVVINPSQQISLIEPYIDFVDYVVLMAVEPGYAGQRFMPDTIGRMRGLAFMRKNHKKRFLISIDGGIDWPNSRKCLQLGADILVTGIYTVFNQEDSLASACQRFNKEMSSIASEI